jgi:hypothetical protein
MKENDKDEFSHDMINRMLLDFKSMVDNGLSLEKIREENKKIKICNC